MLKNYFIIAMRNLTKQRFYTFINVAGLATGVAACLVIVLFVINELSYDKHHEKADRIYRVNGEIKFGGNHYKLAVAPAPLAETLIQDYPEVESAMRFRSRGSYLVKKSETADNIKENDVIWADSTFFKIFTVPVLEGNPNTALKEPNSIAISQNIASKFFPEKSALGQTLIMDNDTPMKVTAVYADMPQTGHFVFDILISLSGLDEAKSSNFLSNNFQTYVLLKEGTDAKAFESKLPGLVLKYIGPQAAEILGGEFTLEKFEASGNKLEYTLMPLTDIHLHSDLTAEIRANGNITYVYLFATIAMFILVIACINFMNLSTARSSNRAKEVGVRKVMGSLRSHLIRQFLMESILLSLFSFVLAIAIAYLFIPVFNDLVQKTLFLPLSTVSFYLLILGAALVIGMLAGLYPSFFLSAFKPANVLKGNVSLGMKSGFIRSALVVFQFVISIFLVIGTITVYRQLSYIQHKKIGFEKDQVIVIQDAYALQDNMQSFKNEVLKNSFILSGTISGFLPVQSWRSDNTHWPEGSQPTQENMVGLQTWRVDQDYVKTLGMRIKTGRFFSADFLSDSSAVVLNESAIRQFGFMGDPLGKKISTFTGTGPDGTPDLNSIQSYTIVGIVEDFHFESLKENITPLGLYLGKSNGSIAFRFEAKETQDVIQSIEKTWKAMAPGQPFLYSFLDEDFSRMYNNEQRLGKTFGVFAGLAIIIASLGLFALTAFTAEQRTKEIGIRKVLGASVSSIVLLLSKEFGKLIIIAFVLASPLAWFAVNWWLKNYTYKVEIGILVYVTAGALAFLIAWLTMGYQSIKAATSNPVRSLRSE
ncbi:MAG: ABC transporter permease [Cyclobacteriaceae bacterium]|nr:ABC transporter permease [Cyclobacteriaceae bacterium]MDH4297817.1 ABC transporter permease [Cyclobacteriaceae bacterium]MDH5250567.1 ABC transporter permease [Cyclobacteriaceae bacterium]